MMNPERQFLPEKSIAIAAQTMAQMNLRAEFRDVGANIKTYHCKLFDDEAKTIFYGCGKGLGLQSKASAYFEALERYFIHRLSVSANDKNIDYHCFQTEEIQKVFPDFMRMAAIKELLGDQKIPAALLADLTGNNKLYYPLFMLDPRYAKTPMKMDLFDYQSLAWLASDSGTASGTSQLEASIHALNELIERDAYSLFLLQAFVSNKSRRVRLINKNSVPSHLQSIIAEIETLHHDELMLFDITSDVGVPVVFVSMTKQAHIFQPRGCGASLDRNDALERALLESLQPLHIYNDELIANQQAIVRNYRRAPLLLDCARADVAAIADKCKVVAFDSMPHYANDLSLQQQYEMITGLIKKQGFNIYHTTIAEHESGFACVRYFVPDFERFYLVQTGKFILPGKRGQSVLN